MEFPFTFKYSDSEMDCKIEFNGYIVLICGDSGTGKTYICNRIYAALREESLQSFIKSNISIKNIEVSLDGTNIENIYSKRNSVIFLDRVDMYLNRKLEQFINENNNNNLFVLMYRGRESSIRVRLTDMFKLKYSIDRGRIQIRNEILL